MKLDNLTPEQMEKAKACTSAEELMALAKEEGVELSDEQLEAVAGGSWSGSNLDCNHYGCGAWDCSMFGCSTVDCPSVDCAVY